MPDLKPISPLAPLGLAGEGGAGAVIEGDGFTVRELPHAAKAILRADLTDEEVRAAVKKVLGVGPPRTSAEPVADDPACLWMRPDGCLVIAADRAPADLVSTLETALASHGGLVLDVSDGWFGVSVEGERARDLLAAGSPLNLHEQAFDAGRAARTMFARVSVVLRRHATANSRFELYADTSLAPYLWGWIRDVAEGA